MKKMEPLSVKNVKIRDAFWSPRQDLIRNTVIPYQWDILNDRVPGVEPSHTIKNFRITSGEMEGDYYGMVFQDSDLYKWLETVGFALAVEQDEKWRKIADEVVELIGRAQQPDGYLNTFYTVRHPEKRWTNLKEDHELYCAGHFIEAAVAYYEATGNQKIIDIATRLVDHISSVLGPEPGKKRGYPGHPEIELALIKLYRITKNPNHLELCRFFIDERGRQPHYFDIEASHRDGDRWGFKNYDYFQAHLPVREQRTAEGHAVRAVYLYSGMADLAAELNDESLLKACRTLWKNVTRKRMYVTGGIGSSAHQERFTVDYDLPNDRAYTETCAAIGLIFWAHRMLQIEADGEYADVMERALYNGALSGISLDGKSYFYVNPLEVWPDACNHRKDMETVKVARQPWFGCACCPPNIARLLASLGQYIYSCNERDKEVFIHLYIGGQAKMVIDGQQTTIEQCTNYPWDGQINITVSLEQEAEFTIALRIPGWCNNASLTVNGEQIPVKTVTEKGYAKIKRVWKEGDRIELNLPMPVEIIRSHPAVRANAGKIAIQRGPVIYCLEEADNGKNLKDIMIPVNTALTAHFEPDLLKGVVVITGEARRTAPSSYDDELYTNSSFKQVPVQIKAIPYYAWSNRGPGEMLVWVREG